MKNKIILIIVIFVFGVSLIIIATLYKKASVKNISTEKSSISSDTSSSSDIITLTSLNYKDEVENSDKIVLIDFFATWCNPCKMMSPIVDDIASYNKGKVKVCKVDVDKQSTLVNKFNVSGIPRIFIIKNNNIIKTFVGVQSKDAIQQAIDNIK